jgi:hypothetical protein
MKQNVRVCVCVCVYVMHAFCHRRTLLDRTGRGASRPSRTGFGVTGSPGIRSPRAFLVMREGGGRGKISGEVDFPSTGGKWAGGVMVGYGVLCCGLCAYGGFVFFLNVIGLD